MATFPALTPNTRSVTFGDYPQLIHVGSSGASVRFLQGTKRVNQKLTLGYNSILESELQLIYDHYGTQEGSLVAFDLPSVIWAGYSAVPISAADYEWRYEGTFQVSPSVPGRFNLTVTLVSSLV